VLFRRTRISAPKDNLSDIFVDAEMIPIPLLIGEWFEPSATCIYVNQSSTECEWLEWHSENPAVLEISESDGFYTAIARDIGTALLWASHWSVVSEPVEIAVHRPSLVRIVPEEAAIAVGETVPYRVMCDIDGLGTNIDCTDMAHWRWQSLTPDVAEISYDGVAEGVAEGLAEIQVLLASEVMATTWLSVFAIW
jgi:hypothetical protein